METIKMETKEKYYYIQKGYIGNAVCWWALNSRGYTDNIENAQRYSLAEAKQATSNPDCKFWPCDYIDNHPEARKIMIDSQYLDSENCVLNE